MAYKKFKFVRAVGALIQVVTSCELQMRNAAKEYRKLQAIIAAGGLTQAQKDALLAQGKTQQEVDDINAQYIAEMQTESLRLLRHGSTRPSYIQSRINQFVTNVRNREGTQAAALALIDNAIATITGGEATRAELQAELAALRVHEDVIVDGYLNQGWTLDVVATYIEANIADEDEVYSQPLELTYVQPWQ